MQAYIFWVAYTLCYVILCKIFIETFASKRNILKRYGESFLILGLVAGLSLTSFFLEENICIKIVINTILTSIVMWIYFEQKVVRMVMLVLLYQGLGMAVEYISMIGLDKLFRNFGFEELSSSIVEIFFGILSQIILFSIILMIRRYFSNNDTEILTEVEWARFIILPFFTIISILVIMAGFHLESVNKYQRNILLCVAFGIFGMNLFVFYLINDILKRESKHREACLFLERAKHETDMFRQIADHFDKQRQREHEYKNHISAISALMKEHKIDELKKYLEKFDDEVTSSKCNMFNTNHTLVNAILDTKYQEAKKKGISFIILKISDLSGLWIEDEDIVVILYNLLNNAIEACGKCENKLIKIKFVIEKGRTVISVMNTYLDPPIIVNGEYQTSKEDAYIHGIGIKNVKNVVDKYGGSYVINDNHNLFQFIIMIPQNIY